ncbi:hypothetical protein ACFJXP_10960 [Enterococcus faecalis]
MKWIDIEELAHVILEQRKNEMNDINEQNVKENVQLALIKIKELKKNCLENINCSFLDRNIMEIVPLLLKTEAEIMNISSIVIYAKFTDEWTLETYLERESQYAYIDYIKNIDYFTPIYKTVCFLPFFCSQPFFVEEN